MSERSNAVMLRFDPALASLRDGLSVACRSAAHSGSPTTKPPTWNA